MNRHVSDGDHTETVQVASSSRDLTYWTVPSVFEGGQPEGEAGKEAEPSRSWTQFRGQQRDPCRKRSLGYRT